MKTKTISSAILTRCRENAMALALGLSLAIPSLALIGGGGVFAGTPQASSQPAVTAPAPQASVLTQQAAVPDFSCQAHPGSWCDLRDWRGFADAYAQPNTQPQAK